MSYQLLRSPLVYQVCRGVPTAWAMECIICDDAGIDIVNALQNLTKPKGRQVG